jgi:hypothetical protein
MGSWLVKAFLSLGRVLRKSDWDPEVLGLGSDVETGLPVAMGIVRGTFLGIAYSWWALLIAIIFIIGLFLTMVAPIRGCASQTPKRESKLPSLGPSQPAIVSPTVNRQDKENSDRAVAVIDCINDFPSEQCRNAPQPLPPDDDWESRLQKERLQVLVDGDMQRYDELIKKHLLIYKQHNTDPCKRGFFPQVCGH